MADSPDFSATYAAMADEQLLDLLASRAELQDAAVAALETEIHRRGLKPGAEEHPPPAVVVPAPEPVSLSDSAAFSGTYRHLADEQLLALVSSHDELVPAAALALDLELQRRGLKPADEATVSTASTSPHRRGGWKTAFAQEEEPARGLLVQTGRAHLFYLRALSLYARRFPLFAALVLPIAVTNHATWLATSYLGQRYWNAHWSFNRTGQDIPLWELYGASAIRTILVWVVGWLCTATVIAATADELDARATYRNALASVWRRFGLVLRTSIVFGIFAVLALVTLAFIGFLSYPVLRHFSVAMPVYIVFSWAMFALMAAAIARTIFMLPEALLAGTGAWKALRLSDRLTDHFLLRIWLAVMECEIVAYYASHYLHEAARAIESLAITPLWTWYAIDFVPTVVVALLQVPLIIIITLLYLDSRARFDAQQNARAAATTS